MYFKGNKENLPTKENFDLFDINSDGVLTSEELFEIFEKEIQIINHDSAAHLELWTGIRALMVST